MGRWGEGERGRGGEGERGREMRGWEMGRDETFFVFGQTTSNKRRQRLLNVTLEFTDPRMPGDKGRGRGKSLELCSQKTN